MKGQFRKDQTSSNAWPKSDSRKCPITNMNRSGTDLKGEGEQRPKEKLSPLPCELILTSAQREKRKIALPSCASLLVPAGSGLWLAQGCFLLLFLPLPRWSTVRVGLIREEDEKDYVLASSRISFQARTRLAGFFWTSCGPPCLRRVV